MASSYNLSAMQLNAPFCPCGAILDIAELAAEGGALKCPDCPLVLTVGTSNTVSVTIKMDGALIQDDQKSSARRDKDLPTVQEECPSCGNDTAYYRTMQLRSADEGQTIFYTCTNAACGWKWKQDS